MKDWKIEQKKVIDKLITEFIKELKPSLEDFLEDYPIDTIEKVRLDDLLDPAFDAWADTMNDINYYR